jgi:23S rRNA (uridine2552-2'-O)-methyltransferase
MQDKATMSARREGLRARSAYKLKEIQRKFGILKKDFVILELGAWPGGWTLIASKHGKVYGIDLKVPKPVENCEFIKGDVYDSEWLENIPKVNLVLSDMAPKTTGMRDKDQFDSFLLSERALEIAKLKLVKGGNFVCKIFQGPEFNEFRDAARECFQKLHIYKPPTSKDKSKEIYVVGIGFSG